MRLISRHPGLLGSKIRAIPPGVDGHETSETVVADDRVRYREQMILLLPITISMDMLVPQAVFNGLKVQIPWDRSEHRPNYPVI